MSNPHPCICAPGATPDPTCEAHRVQCICAPEFIHRDCPVHKDDYAHLVSTAALYGTPPITRSLRRRANIKSTSKGDLSFDCTVDGTGYTEPELLMELYSLATKLQQTCHPATPENMRLTDDPKEIFGDDVAAQLQASIDASGPPEAGA